MLRNILRFAIVALIAVALGLLIYHLNQPTGTATAINNFSRFSGDFGGEGSFREGSFSLARGLFDVAGNLLLVAFVTVIVVSLQKAFAHQPRPAKMR